MRTAIGWIILQLLVFVVPPASPAFAADDPPAALKDCLTAREREHANDWEQAANFYSTCLEVKGLDNRVRAAIHIDRGNAYGVTGRTEKAIEDFTRATQLDPANSMAFNNRANIYRSLGRPDKAVADYTKASELSPKNAVILSNRGNAYKGLKQFDKAAADLDRAIELDPSFANAYYNRACLESVRKNTEAACRWLGKAFEKGFSAREVVETDADLDNIRDAPCFRKLVGMK